MTIKSSIFTYLIGVIIRHMAHNSPHTRHMDYYVNCSSIFSISFSLHVILQVFMKNFISSLSFIVIKMDFYEGRYFFIVFRALRVVVKLDCCYRKKLILLTWFLSREDDKEECSIDVSSLKIYQHNVVSKTKWNQK